MLIVFLWVMEDGRHLLVMTFAGDGRRHLLVMAVAGVKRRHPLLVTKEPVVFVGWSFACDPEIMAGYYGARWREYNGRYEIGLASTSVVDAAGFAAGGAVSDAVALSSAEQCEVSDGSLAACLARAGYRDFVLLGKVDGASPTEGVAQLINDHSAIQPPREMGEEGASRPDNLEPFTARSAAWPFPAISADTHALNAAVARYVANIEPRNNVALVQAASADAADGGAACDIDDPTTCTPRLFAVATRDIAAGEELYFTYGVEWWLQQLRRAALAQLVTCDPPETERAALTELLGALQVHWSSRRGERERAG